MRGLGERWVRFLRLYGPTPHNENMYDEHINRSARRLDVRPISFQHPVQTKLLALLQPDADRARSIVLTGTAGDCPSSDDLRRFAVLRNGGSGPPWLRG